MIVTDAGVRSTREPGTEKGPMPYTILRKYRDGSETEIIAEGLTLEEAQAHCQSPDTSSSTTQSKEGRARTKEKGPWFDCYTDRG